MDLEAIEDQWKTAAPTPTEGESTDSAHSSKINDTVDQASERNSGSGSEERASMSPIFPPVTVDDVKNCAFSAWYERFRKITLKSVIIPLPEEFVDYLNSDGVFLPLDR
jgi:hypothetical protein